MRQVHATSLVGDGVLLGERVTVGPHAVLVGPCRIGDDCWIGPGAVIGTPPEITSARHNRAWDGELAHCGVEIGPRTVVRELTTIQQGSVRPTRIGADCWLLSKVYVPHDCHIGDGVTLSATVSLGGHVRVGDDANLGMNAVVHQGRVIGDGAMVGMGSAVTRDVPPYAKAFGNPVRLHGVNAVGMARLGIAKNAVDFLAAAYTQGRVPGTAEVPESLVAAFEWWAAAQPDRPLCSLGVLSP